VAKNPSAQSNGRIEREFLVLNGILWIRETSRADSYSPEGDAVGESVQVTMRPATVEEVQEWKCVSENWNR